MKGFPVADIQFLEAREPYGADHKKGQDIDHYQDRHAALLGNSTQDACEKDKGCDHAGCSRYG